MNNGELMLKVLVIRFWCGVGFKFIIAVAALAIAYKVWFQ